jgi:hypothetical protein
MHRHRDFQNNRPPRERRSHPRLLCSSLAEVTWRNAPTGCVLKEIAVMEDFAPTGACLLMGLPVDRGSGMTIKVGGRTFHGVVQHCRREQSGYLVGVWFPTEDESGTDQYLPEHCLDVSRLDFSPQE